MSRQNTPNTGRERKPEGQKRDAAAHTLRFDAPTRDQHYAHARERGTRDVSMNRNYLNDLYERSSI